MLSLSVFVVLSCLLLFAFLLFEDLVPCRCRVGFVVVVVSCLVFLVCVVVLRCCSLLFDVVVACSVCVLLGVVCRLLLFVVCMLWFDLVG